MKILVGLGGNLGEPPRAFARALEALGDELVVAGVSRLYRSRPVGPPQPEYWNMAAVIEITIPVLTLLDRCQELEELAGRERRRGERWGPRPLDLDLLMAEGAVHRGPRLVLPHPRFHERAFAVVPAAELVPTWVHPHLGRSLLRLAEELQKVDPEAVRPAAPWGV